MARRKATSKRHRTPVGKKISKLRHEGVKQDQAVAMALNMKRRGRLTKSGGYRRVHRRTGGKR